ncbi:MAG: YhcH/YjgK/YiaL family protein [Lachnospiraceae bacterium]|nr:YhcH/YjgK/YiaL family protein [Lachnospiraceae bacterium]
MIIDQLDNILFYEKMLPNLANGMAKVTELGAAPEVGRYEFEGGYLMVQKGETKPLDEGTFEAHRKYIDVQILLEGCEEVAWKPLSELTSVIPYDEAKDAERFDGTKENTMLISGGMFYAAYPKDGHKPVSHSKEKHTFTKIVMKLPVA